MPRARNVKPGFFKNEHLPDVSFQGRLLFIGLWLLSDREGRMEYRPRRIKGELFPYEDCDVDEIICQLSSLNFVKRYEVSGVQYLQIVNFSKHQRPHPNEKASELPSPDDDESTREKDVSDQSDTRNPDTRNPDTRNPDTRNPDTRNPDTASSAEPLDAGGDDSDDPVVEQIPLNDGSEHPVRQSDVAEYQRLYPAVDVLQELRKCRGWNGSNPRKRKTRNGIRSHITQWMGRAQDRGGSSPQDLTGPRALGAPYSRNQGAVEQAIRETEQEMGNG